MQKVKWVAGSGPNNILGYDRHPEAWWKKHAHPGSLTVTIRVLCWGPDGQQVSELHKNFDSFREAKAYAKANVESGGRLSTVELRVEGYAIGSAYPTNRWGSTIAIDYGSYEPEEDNP